MFVVVVSTALIQRYVQGRMPQGWFNNMANALLYLANLEPFHPYTKSIWKHTYSMATQEQWYLLWSLSLPFLLATTRRNRNAAMLAVILISYLGYSAWTAGLYIHSPLFDTFGLLTWIGKLQVGAFMRLNTIPQFLRSKWAVWIGLVLFTFSALDATYGSDDKIEWLGLSRRFFSREIYNTYAALVVSIFLVAGSIYNSVWLFDTQALRFMGRISYSWFLFQVPLLEIVGWPRNYVGIAITCMAYVMASFSTIYIEERIKDLNKAIRTARSKPSRSDNEVAVSKS
jgi:peptidoglycan/LPS O-acetylase OafA/YrhL